MITPDGINKVVAEMVGFQNVEPSPVTHRLMGLYTPAKDQIRTEVPNFTASIEEVHKHVFPKLREFGDPEVTWFFEHLLGRDASSNHMHVAEVLETLVATPLDICLAFIKCRSPKK